MSTRLFTKTLAQASLLALAAFATVPASAVVTTYASGDVFIGFRQTGVTNTVVANLGSVTKFLPPSLGGTWNGNPFNVTFGLVPNTSTVVTNLNADLVANFGLNWAANAIDGTSVRWAVVGITDNSLANTPITGYAERTAFVTKPRTDPAVQSTTLSSVSNNNFGSAFTAFAAGIGGGAYISQNSTANSSVTYIGDGSETNNWNTKIGANGAFSLGSGRVVEQLNSGAFQGPTNSVLDFYVAPSTGSTLTTARTFTGGSFTLDAAGRLTYSAVPEPGTATLLAFGLTAVGFVRRRRAGSALSVQA